MKHPIPRLLALVAVASLALSACSTSSSDDPSGSSSDLTEVTVEGEAGAEPTVTFETPFTVAGIESRVETPGTGDELKDGQTLSINLAAYSGADGSKLGDTWTTGTSQIVTLGDAAIIPDLTTLLVGQKVGTRFVMALPAAGENPAQVMVGEVDSIAFDPDTPVEGELPTATFDESGKPSVSFPEGYAPPAGLAVETLTEGDGAVVTSTDTITAHYTGWTLDGQQFDSSWDRGEPSSFSLQQVVPGWTIGLTGQKVGSTVLLVIPPELAYGEETGAETDHELAGQTLTFVVTIEAVEAAATQ